MVRRFCAFLFLLAIAPALYAVDMCSPTNQVSNAASDSFFDSGGAGGNYGNGENCTLLIQPAISGTITLTFSDFETQNNQDALSIYDGVNASAPLLGTFFWQSKYAL